MTRTVGYASAIFLSILCWAGAARAMPPTNIFGIWTGFSDNETITLVISQGGSRNGACTAITGTITDQTAGTTNKIVGFYCSGTGRFSFLRYLGSPSQTTQAYVGSASEVGSTTTVQYLTGTFGQEATGTTTLDLGEYSFEVTK